MSLLLLDDHAFRTSTLLGTADFAVELGLGVAPWADVEVWADITRYVRDINSISGGRKRNLDRAAAGKFSFVVDNSDRRFDPTYAAGPYYGNLRPNTPVRFRLQRGTTHAFMFEGFIDGWPQSFRPPAVSLLTLSATDGFKLLAGAELGDCLLDTLQRRDGATNRWKFGDSGDEAIDDLGGMNLTYNNSPDQSADPLAAGSTGSAVGFSSGSAGREVVEGRVGSLFTAPLSFEFVIRSNNADDPSHANVIAAFMPNDGAFTYGYIQLAQNTLPAPITPGQIVFVMGGGYCYGGPVCTDNAVHHGILTVSAAGAIHLYVDGDEVTTFLGRGGVYSRSWPVLADVDVNFGIGNLPVSNAIGDFGFDDGSIHYFTAYVGTILTAAQAAEHADAALSGGEGDTSGERADRVLDAIGFPASKRAIDAGSTVVTVDGYGGKASEYLALLAQTERGQAYFDGEGKYTHRGRTNILTDTRSASSQATFSDDVSWLLDEDGEPILDETGAMIESEQDWVHYSDIEPTYDELQIRNPVTITRTGGKAMVAQDQVKIDEFGAPNDYDESGLLYTNDFESLSVAQWILANDKDPRRRIERLVIEPQSNVTATADALWEQVMSRQIGDRVTVEDKPLNIGDRNSVDILEEGFEHSMVAGKWRTTLYGSPAQTQAFWLLGVAGFSELGTTTTLGF